MEVLVWQTFASVLIPGYTINRIVHFTGSTSFLLPSLQSQS